MAVEAAIPTIAAVVTTAIIDSINPCAIGVLILMLSVVMAQHGKVGKMLLLGGLYIFAVFMTYLLAGIGLLYFLANIPLWVTEYIAIAVGLLITGAGILEIKDFFWYGRWFSLTIPPAAAHKIHDYAKNATVPGVLFLGAFVAGVELPCTGAPYLAIITLLSQYFDFTAFLLLVLYNVIFVAPLIVILIMVSAGTKLYEVKKWKQEARGSMRLFIGLLLVGLGWLLMLIANGTINLG
jgi:cytochrome c biogenesis protein CcdA